MQAEEAKWLNQLEKENARLKKLLADAELKRRFSRSLRWEISKPGTPPQGCGNPGRHIPGMEAVRLRGGGPTPEYQKVFPQGCRY